MAVKDLTLNKRKSTLTQEKLANGTSYGTEPAALPLKDRISTTRMDGIISWLQRVRTWQPIYSVQVD